MLRAGFEIFEGLPAQRTEDVEETKTVKVCERLLKLITDYSRPRSGRPSAMRKVKL